MKQGQDIVAKFPGILIIHQKIRANTVEKHLHEEHEIFLPLQGEIRIQLGDKTLSAGPGRMIYLPPNLEHSFQSSSNTQGERLIFFIDSKEWKSYQGGQFSASTTSASQLSKELLFHLLIHPKTKAAKSLIQTLIQTISEMLETSGLNSIGDVAHLYGVSSDLRLKNALELIQAKFNARLSMEELAKRSGLSVRNLNRLFLQELGMTPKQVITLHRIENAKALLKRGQQSVTDIAFEVGYHSVSQFITTFRNLTGQLPSNIHGTRVGAESQKFKLAT
jgi:AraC-like DNA-binding protein/mannose-6-phosphate isomerase-like protein (cupin superfamily)